MDASLRPDDFACAMQAHWTDNLGNASSPALVSLWTLMGETFNKAVAGNPGTVNPFREIPCRTSIREGVLLETQQGVSPKGLWHVLSPATGSGKTQGVRIYCAMRAALNLTAPPEEKVGALIVTREIEAADELAREINETSETHIEALIKKGVLLESQCGFIRGPVVALSRHSKNAGRVTLADMRSAPVLIVTHAAYVRALDMLSSDMTERWSSLIEWEHGQRRLVVVDESISSLVEAYQLDIEGLARSIGYIRQPIRERFPGQVARLETVLRVLREVRTMTNKELVTANSEEDEEVNDAKASTADRAVWNMATKRDPEIAAMLSTELQWNDMSGLRKAITEDRGREEAWIEKSGGLSEKRARTVASRLSEHRWLSATIDHDLKSVQAICSRWAWYARSGKRDTLNSSRLLLPEPFPVNVVVLDATAKQEVLWKLLGKDRVVRPEAPKGVRNYANVTLNVSRVAGGGLGKGKMTEKGKARLARLVEHLNERFAGQSDRKVFMVTHKAIEHLAMDHELTFGELSVAHWGSLDGKNEWSNHDTAVIMGLSYRSRIWANNLYQAVNGRQDTEWFRSNLELRRDMEVKQLTASLVQAINRIRCRRVIDDKGNCPPSEVFLFLRDGDEGDTILEGIKSEMPGVVVKPWEHSLDGPRATIRRNSSHEGLIAMLDNYPEDGEWPMTWIEKEFSLSKRGAEALRSTLRNPESPLAQRLAAMGFSFVTHGVGRGAKSFLVKRSTRASVKAA